MNLTEKQKTIMTLVLKNYRAAASSMFLAPWTCLTDSDFKEIDPIIEFFTVFPNAKIVQPSPDYSFEEILKRSEK